MQTRSPPLKIVMMLHYYAIAAPYAEYDPAHRESQAVAHFRDELIRDGLIEADPASPSGYTATERGRVWVDMICDTPLPIQKWSPPD